MLTHSSHAADRAFRMPGQELWGKWKVVSLDVSSLVKPLGEDFFKKMNEREAFFPVGQAIEIEGSYQVSFVPRSVTLGTRVPYSAPEFTLRLIAPFPDEFCENTRWNFLCDQSKRLQENQSFGGQIFFKIGTSDLRRKALWPTLSVIEYQLILDMEFWGFSVNLLGPDRMVAHLHYSAPGALDDLPVGVIFERLKE